MKKVSVQTEALNAVEPATEALLIRIKKMRSALLKRRYKALRTASDRSFKTFNLITSLNAVNGKQ